MGFLDKLGRFMQGKPIFEALPASPGDSTPKQQQKDENRGPKYIPKVKVREIETHNIGSHIRIAARIVNDSSERVELDKIRLLGTEKKLDTWLNAGEEREMTIFEGDRLNHRNYDDAWLDYRDESGDYFQQYHTVEFNAQQSDGTYEVRRIQAAGPVKDI